MEQALLLLIPSVTSLLIQNEERINHRIYLEKDACARFCDSQCNVLVESINI
jgi:hypothetical protein